MLGLKLNHVSKRGHCKALKVVWPCRHCPLFTNKRLSDMDLDLIWMTSLTSRSNQLNGFHCLGHECYCCSLYCDWCLDWHPCGGVPAVFLIYFYFFSMSLLVWARRRKFLTKLKHFCEYWFIFWLYMESPQKWNRHTPLNTNQFGQLRCLML